MSWARARGAMMSKRLPNWRTPALLYADLDREFRFTLDPCTEHGWDGLFSSWAGERVYCNPPYGGKIGEWLSKATEADVAVYLLPARTDTEWWHTYALKADEIRFLRGRLKFEGAAYNAPFPSVILVYAAKPQGGGAGQT